MAFYRGGEFSYESYIAPAVSIMIASADDPWYSRVGKALEFLSDASEECRVRSIDEVAGSDNSVRLRVAQKVSRER